MSAPASMPLQYKRLYKGLLDADGVFESLEAAEEYAAGPTGAPGHVIGVLVDGIREAYVVQDDGTLKKQLTQDDISSAMSWEEVPEPEVEGE